MDITPDQNMIFMMKLQNSFMTMLKLYIKQDLRSLTEVLLVRIWQKTQIDCRYTKSMVVGKQ